MYCEQCNAEENTAEWSNVLHLRNCQHIRNFTFIGCFKNVGYCQYRIHLVYRQSADELKTQSLLATRQMRSQRVQRDEGYIPTQLPVGSRQLSLLGKICRQVA